MTVKWYHPGQQASANLVKDVEQAVVGVAPDLDSAEQIDRFVALFYQRLLVDRRLSPWFNEVARIRIEEHLPIISLYWQKMLLGDTRYQRHTMQKHRDLDNVRRLGGAQYEAWLGHFDTVARENFSGPNTDRARRIAARVIDNLYHQLNP